MHTKLRIMRAYETSYDDDTASPTMRQRIVVKRIVALAHRHRYDTPLPHRRWRSLQAIRRGCTRMGRDVGEVKQDRNYEQRQ